LEIIWLVNQPILSKCTVLAANNTDPKWEGIKLPNLSPTFVKL